MQDASPMRVGQEIVQEKHQISVGPGEIAAGGRWRIDDFVGFAINAKVHCLDRLHLSTTKTARSAEISIISRDARGYLFSLKICGRLRNF